MLRTFVVIGLTIGSAFAADAGIFAVPVSGHVARPGPVQYDAPALTPAPVSNSPDALWLQFDRMTLAERKNAELSLQPSSEALPGAWDECRAICRLWNRGEYDVAVERLRGYYRFDDPCRVLVAVSWRTPIETPQPGWGPDIRIGAHDSIDDLTMDCRASGELMAATPSNHYGYSHVIIYHSLDNGSSWQQLSWIGYTGGNYLSAWSAASHGEYYHVSFAHRGSACNRVWGGRYSLAQGAWINFPGDSVCIVAMTAAAGDSIRELAECSQEDTLPGFRIYLFGRTQNRLLCMSWSDSSCGGWRPHSTNVGTCDKGLDCTFSQGSAVRKLWASWLHYYGTDSAKLAFGYFTTADTLFHPSTFANEHSPVSTFEPTSITAWHDTIQMAYATSGTRCRNVYSFDAGATGWWGGWLNPDTLLSSGLPEVSARKGGGFAAASRTVYLGYDRWVVACHASQVGGPYSGLDTLSEPAHRPCPTARIRIIPLGSGSYGVGWINWDDAVYQGAWFQTYTPAGIAERPARVPVSLSFSSAPSRGGANLSFDNPAAGLVRLRIFDRAGRLVRSERRLRPAGRQSISFSAPSSGVYVAVLQAGERTASARFAAVR
jgi:hypothetical protein